MELLFLDIPVYGVVYTRHRSSRQYGQMDSDRYCGSSKYAGNEKPQNKLSSGNVSFITRGQTVRNAHLTASPGQGEKLCNFSQFQTCI